ncbi:hypothetical protein I3J27_14340 [Bradyrhizobium xenonodulans]|uniref:Uncharacterized protein n=1 Tax=Bradyrhizobium xenonodulans TaxID=2736875 RepID=A0ABY7MVS7_9BRAD|nr:hypothetical protein [Bradyrhizobium xenonodulans]WBL81537.1 hypothetical protein I3J27_14340 [Bradyrhizobium xenonodulans]
MVEQRAADLASEAIVVAGLKDDDLDKIASNGLIHEELLALLHQALQ